jgi:ABC-type phosphate transport system substrate-binding protein
MTRSTPMAVLLSLTLLAAPLASAGEGYKVVVNPNNPTSSVSKAQLSALFLKKTPWPNGQAVQPIDLAEDAAVRRAFTAAVHARPVSAIKAYWQQKVFTGRDVQPTEEAGDAAVVAFVHANPGAVGYVSEAFATGDLKVLAVNP